MIQSASVSSTVSFSHLHIHPSSPLPLTELRHYFSTVGLFTFSTFIIQVVGGVDGLFSLADQFYDGTFVVFAAVDKPLHNAYDDDDEEGDDAVIWREILLVWAAGEGR